MNILGSLHGKAPGTADLSAIGDFELERYLGRWYEIARLPQWFEKNMGAVTADYTMQPNGMIKVENRGWRGGKLHEAVGWAKPKGDATVGELRVSFFRPFWADYRIILLDRNYSWAVVTGSRRSELWILARCRTLAPETQRRLLRKLEQWNFAVNQLEFSGSM